MGALLQLAGVVFERRKATEDSMVLPGTRVIAAGVIALAVLAGSCGGDQKSAGTPPAGSGTPIAASAMPSCEAPPSAPSSWTNANGMPVSGILVDDSTGKPIGNGRVTVKHGTGGYSIQADEDGRFEIQASPSSAPITAAQAFEITGDCTPTLADGSIGEVTLFGHLKRNVSARPAVPTGAGAAPGASAIPSSAQADDFKPAELEEALRFKEGLSKKKPERFAAMAEVFDELATNAGPHRCGLVSPLRDAILERSAEPKVGVIQLPAGVDVKTFERGRFAIKYATSGEHGNLLKPTNTTDQKVWRSDGTAMKGDVDDKGVPIVVQQVAIIANDAWSIFEKRRGLVDPVPTGLIEIQMMSLGSWTGVTHPTWGHIVLNTKNRVKVNQVIVPHEIFHRVQFAYGCNRGSASPDPDNECYARSNGLRDMFLEGGALLAEDGVDDGFNCYVAYAKDLLETPQLSLASVANPNDDLSDSTLAPYRAGLFWKYFVEQCAEHQDDGEPLPYMGQYRRALVDVGGAGLAALSKVTCGEREKRTFAGLFADHFVAGFLLQSQDPLAMPGQRYAFEERSERSLCPTRELEPSLGEQSLSTFATVTLRPGTRLSCSGRFRRWSARALRVEMASGDACESTVDVNAPGCTIRVILPGENGTAVLAADDHYPVAPGMTRSGSMGIVTACHDEPTTQVNYEVLRYKAANGGNSK